MPTIENYNQTQDEAIKQAPPKDNQGNFEEKIIGIVKQYLDSAAFSDRKLTDTPTDSLSVVNRKYVTMNGVSANRPTASVIGQSYLDTTLASGRGKPVWWNGTGFVDATGTYV